MEEMKIKQIYVTIPKMFKHSLTHHTEMKQISSTHKEDLPSEREKKEALCNFVNKKNQSDIA